MTPVVVVPLAEFLESPAVAVGHAKDEDPFPSMWRADFLRRKQSERAAETASRQVPKDAIEAEREMTGDVLEEDSARSKSPDDVVHGRPQMTRVLFSQSLACFAEWLAGVAPGNPVDLRKFIKG